MNKPIYSLVTFALFTTVAAGVAHAGVVRPGDQLKIKLVAAFNAVTAHSGDGFPVTLPDGLQVDPSGPAEIARGTSGTATFRLLEKSPTAIKYEIQSFLFTARTDRVEIRTGFSATDPTAGTLAIQKASIAKKLLLPPLFGFLIWKDTAILPAGKEISIEVAEEKRW